MESLAKHVRRTVLMKPGALNVYTEMLHLMSFLGLECKQPTSPESQQAHTYFVYSTDAHQSTVVLFRVTAPVTRTHTPEGAQLN